MSSVAFNIVEIRENKLLARREVVVEVIHQGASTPTRQSLREIVARQLGVEVSNVYIRKIVGGYGLARSRAEVHVYSDAKIVKIIEPLYVLARNLGEEGKKMLEEARRKRNERREKRRKKK